MNDSNGNFLQIIILFRKYDSIGSFNKDARHLSSDSGHVYKAFSAKFVVNCSLVCGKTLMEHNNIEKRVQHINIYFKNQCVPFKKHFAYYVLIILATTVLLSRLISNNND